MRLQPIVLLIGATALAALAIAHGAGMPGGSLRGDVFLCSACVLWFMGVSCLVDKG